VQVSCFCGKESQYFPCQVSQRSKFTCSNPCGKLLNCLKHLCQDPCHEGPCKPCAEVITIPCFCQKLERQALCGSSTQKCGKVCGSMLDCGKHQCERRCHEGLCEPCPKDP